VDFTIVVPTFNRPEQLAGCIRSLTALEEPCDSCEILIVDDGGSADLRGIILSAPSSIRIRLLRQENRGAGAARNAGARDAQGQWLAFTDDDCRPHAGWLKGLRVELEKGLDVLAGGRTINQLRYNVFAATSQIVVDAAYRYYNRDRTRGRFLASNNMGVWRERLLAVGGFDESFRPASEDRELSDRWTWRGGRIVWTDHAVVEHCHDLKFESFLRQHYRYGRGAWRFHRVRTARGTGRLWDDISCRWHWIDLLLKPALASARPPTILVLLAWWQAANTVGFAREALNDTTRWKGKVRG
jgi:glycosyltransferase involved in cell wall biosynthesis